MALPRRSWKVACTSLPLFLVSGCILAVAICACSTPTLSDTFHLFRIVDPDTEIRVGYFGICTSLANKFTCSFKAPIQQSAHITMALEVRRKVFLPLFVATAGALFALAYLLMLRSQTAEWVRPSVVRCDNYARLAYGLACWVQICGLLIVWVGRQGIIQALQYAGNGTKVEAGQGMLVLHVTLLVFYTFLYIINWSLTCKKSFSMSISRVFFKRSISKDVDDDEEYLG